MNRLSIAALSLLLVVTSACDRSRELAANLDRTAGYLDTAGALVANQVTAGTISTSTGSAIVADLRQVNRLNADLISTARGYLAADGSLRLTGDGQARLLAIVGSARQVISSRLLDPEFSKLSPSARLEIERNLREVEKLLELVTETIQTAKLLKEGK